MSDPLDREKPKIRLDERLCTGCWAVEKADVAIEKKWKAYDFDHLACTVLCPECQYKYGDDFDKLKENGL